MDHEQRTASQTRTQRRLNTMNPLDLSTASHEENNTCGYVCTLGMHVHITVCVRVDQCAHVMCVAWGNVFVTV